MTENPYRRPDTCQCGAYYAGECACGGYVDTLAIRSWDEGYAAGLKDGAK